MRVAISDSDKKFCQKVERMLKRYEEEKRIHVELEVLAAEEGLSRWMETGRQFDLVILDDLWRHRDDIAAVDVDIGAAAEERKVAYLPRIVYVSFQERQVIELVDVSSSHLPGQPMRRKRIFSLLDELNLVHDHYLFSYVRERVKYQIPYSEIVFFQSDGRKIEIYTIDSDTPKEYIGKLSEIQKQGLPPDFITIHKSYIVNIRYISRRSYEMVFLEEKWLWLSISQNNRKHVREVLERYSIERISDDKAVAEVLQQNY